MPQILDKYTPSYKLESFKRSHFTVTKTALLDALALGFSRADMEEAVGTMEAKHFYKSMTSKRDHTVWQDVYHVPFRGLLLYIKFTKDNTIAEFRLLSFKEK